MHEKKEGMYIDGKMLVSPIVIVVLVGNFYYLM
jgi:hypothetical protein